LNKQGEKNMTKQKLTFIPKDFNGRFFVNFQNGHWLSVIGGEVGQYGNGKDTFELFSSEHNDLDVEAFIPSNRVQEVLDDMFSRHGEVKSINGVSFSMNS
jgi:hypothetical protein